MSFDGSVELLFGGDMRRFRLGIAELIALQDKRDSGPLEIVKRLSTGAWRIEDISETIRIGLQGAGMDPKSARALTEANVREGRLTEHALTALATLLHALQGDPSEPNVGKARAVMAPGTDVSASPPSIATAQ